MTLKISNLEKRLQDLTAPELRRLLVEQLTKQKMGLYWESDAIQRDAALNADIVLPRLVPEYSHAPEGTAYHQNLIIEGDNFDSLRLLRATHAGKIRVIYIDPPYNTGNKDWVYNDKFVGANDRWRHSQWLEFLHQRLTLARDLLMPDGVIMVSINDENRSRLELLMDEVFPGRRLGSLVWRTKDTGNDLSQRFSHVHEHVLVYANSEFKFNGRITDKRKFRNPDKDHRGIWSAQPLTSNKTLTERSNTYYPIQNPETGYWYPCDPDSVWRFASEKEIRKRLGGDEVAILAALAGLRSDTIEQFIEKGLIYFPPCASAEVMIFENKSALISAIQAGSGPILPKKKTPLLRADLPDLEFWIGKPIASGRPSRKEFWSAKPESDRLAPLGSWIAGLNEELIALSDDEDGEPVVLRSAKGGAATDEVKNVLGSKAFHHPKPLSLIRGLLVQATRPTDIVLDFFAGSGTTALAVLDLNREDGGQRRFILCSSTEATGKDPDKNLCLEVCAERLRRVIKGYGNEVGYTKEQGGEFAYIQLDKIDPSSIAFEASTDNAAQLLSMREAAAALVVRPDSALQVIAKGDDWVSVLCTDVTSEAIAELGTYPALYQVKKLVVYCARPKSLQEILSEKGLDVVTHSIEHALARGQGSRAVFAEAAEEDLT